MNIMMKTWKNGWSVVIMNKEYLYVGHYIDIDGNYILKVGTTKNPTKRRYQHNTYYRKKAKHNQMPQEESFQYDWLKEFSLSNTKKYENKAIQNWIELEIGEYIRNDRFCCQNKPKEVSIVIRKTYTIAL